MIEPRAIVKRLGGFFPPEHRYGKLRLDSGEWTCEAPAPLVAAIQKITSDQLVVYPEYGTLTAKLAAFLGVPADCVMPFNGSDDALRTIALTFFEPGHRVVTISPTFGMIPIHIALAGAQAVNVRLLDDPDLSVDMPGIRAALHEAHALILANPNNPTGSWVAPERLAELAADHPDQLIVVDEAYGEFAPSRSLRDVPRLDNLIVTGTFSKALGLAGVRLGYLVAHPQLIASLRIARAPYGVNAMAVHFGEAAIDTAPEWLPERLAAIGGGKHLLVDGLKRLGVTVHPGHANFVIGRFGIDAGWLAQQLTAAEILVRDVSRVPGLSGGVRFGVGTPAQMVRLMAVLHQCFSGRRIVIADDVSAADLADGLAPLRRRYAIDGTGLDTPAPDSPPLRALNRLAWPPPPAPPTADDDGATSTGASEGFVVSGDAETLAAASAQRFVPIRWAPGDPPSSASPSSAAPEAADYVVAHSVADLLDLFSTANRPQS